MNYLHLIQPIIAQAAALIKQRFRSDIDISIKNKTSLVTNVDILVQDFLIQQLTQAIPGSGVIAEEDHIKNEQLYTWIIDPIDGTINFARGLPYFCINVALQHQGQIVAALTHAPMTHDWFWAEQGGGFWFNDQKIEHPLEQAGSSTHGLVVIVISAFLLAQQPVLLKIKQAFKDRGMQVKFRINGAIALDLAYTAAGVFDLVLTSNLAIWDKAAGALMIEQAGGLVHEEWVEFEGGKQRMLIAGTRECVQVLKKI
jgi:myo-inositol-1(or 4)-monophosphatase